MIAPNPALVTQRGARRLPRLALLLLAAAYLLPGLFGRDPWRNADLTAFGHMLALAEGRAPWWSPTLGGVLADTALLPHWLGALAIKAGQGWLEPALAARLPFTLLLALTLALTWYATFHLARTEAAQPVAFAFGGEAEPVDYARAIADGALLALMATLGLLVLGHQTTPELTQLCAVAAFLYGLAASPYRARRARVALLLALPALAASGAPSIAMGLGLAGLLITSRSRFAVVRAQAVWLAVSMALAAGLAASLQAWHWRAEAMTAGDWANTARQWLWFLWPAWPLALLTLWRWRRQWSYRHVSVPLAAVLVALVANLVMAGSDRALLLGLPSLAMLAAFALPTMKRAATAAIDWFSMCFFSAFAVWVWFVYIAIQTGWPAWQAANVAKLLPGFSPRLQPLALAAAVLGTAAWVAVVRWRTGRHREALWKSLVLPASGVALCWLLAMTLWLPPLDYARSPRPLVQQLQRLLPPASADTCIWTPSQPPAGVAALEAIGGWRVEAQPQDSGRCGWRLHSSRSAPPLADAEPGWRLVGSTRRPNDREEVHRVYQRQ